MAMMARVSRGRGWRGAREGDEGKECQGGDSCGPTMKWVGPTCARAHARWSTCLR